MKKILVYKAALCLTVLPSVIITDYAYAQMAVFDGQGLLQDIKILEEEIKNTKIVTEIFETNKLIQNALEGNLKIGRGIQSKISKIRGSVEDYTHMFNDLSLSIDLEDYDLSNIEDISKILDLEFEVDLPMNESINQGYKHEAMRTKAVKSALEDSMRISAEINENMSEISELSNETDQANNMSEKMDVNNRLLLTVVRILQELLILNARVTQAEQLANYRGEIKTNNNSVSPLPVGNRNPYDPTDTRTMQELYDQREKFECTDCSDDTKELLDLL